MTPERIGSKSSLTSAGRATLGSPFPASKPPTSGSSSKESFGSFSGSQIPGPRPNSGSRDTIGSRNPIDTGSRPSSQSLIPGPRGTHPSSGSRGSSRPASQIASERQNGPPRSGPLRQSSPRPNLPDGARPGSGRLLPEQTRPSSGSRRPSPGGPMGRIGQTAQTGRKPSSGRSNPTDEGVQQQSKIPSKLMGTGSQNIKAQRDKIQASLDAQRAQAEKKEREKASSIGNPKAKVSSRTGRMPLTLDAVPPNQNTQTGSRVPAARLKKAGPTATVPKSRAPTNPDHDAFEEDDVEYSWPPRKRPDDNASQETSAASSLPTTYAPSPRTSKDSVGEGSPLKRSIAEEGGFQSFITRELFSLPVTSIVPEVEEKKQSSSRALHTDTADTSLSRAQMQARARSQLQVPFQVVQVIDKGSPLFPTSRLSAQTQYHVQSWVNGNCAGELVALALLNRPAFFIEDEKQKQALDSLATTPEGICKSICQSTEVLASELESRFLQQEAGNEVAAGLWREVVRQGLKCPTVGFDSHVLRNELKESPPQATWERNEFIGRYIYELLQIKRELLSGSGDSAYEILGVKPDASDAVIRKAYRQLCLKHHPDKGGDPAQFLEIQRAYQMIKEMRKEERGETDEIPAEKAQNEEKNTSASNNSSGQNNDDEDANGGNEKQEKTPEPNKKEIRPQEPHPLVAKLMALGEKVRLVREAAKTSVVARKTIESLQKTPNLGSVQEASKTAQSVIEDALMIIAQGLGEETAKQVLAVAKICIDLPEQDASTALVVQEGMQMLIKGKALQESSKALKPVQREIMLTLDTLRANLNISNMLGSMDEETAKMSLRLVAEASRRAQSALSTVLSCSESLEVCIGTAVLHAQSIITAPPSPAQSSRCSTPEAKVKPPPVPKSAPQGPKVTLPTTSRVEAIASDQRQLLKRLIEEIELLRRPLTNNGLQLALRVVTDAVVTGFIFSLDDPFDIPNAALKAILHHPEGHSRIGSLCAEMRILNLSIPTVLENIEK